LSLWAEHLDRSTDDAELLDFANASALWEQTARELASWKLHPGGRARPSSRVRSHEIEPVPPGNQRWAEVVYRLIFDPDGRPFRLRTSHTF
jgi:hypothetical protein